MQLVSSNSDPRIDVRYKPPRRIRRAISTRRVTRSNPYLRDTLLPARAPLLSSCPLLITLFPFLFLSLRGGILASRLPARIRKRSSSLPVVPWDQFQRWTSTLSILVDSFDRCLFYSIFIHFRILQTSEIILLQIDTFFDSSIIFFFSAVSRNLSINQYTYIQKDKC